MPVVSFSTGSLAAGAAYTATFGVGDIDGTFPGNAGLITPRVDMYIDTDANAAYLWPNGVTLTSSSKRALCFIQVARTPSANQKITLQAYVENRDTVAHTYYCTVDAIYLTGMK